MKRISKLLLLVLVILTIGCKSQKYVVKEKDVAAQEELNKKMDEFYNRDYKIMALDIINGKNNYFYKCIWMPKNKENKEKYFLLFIIKTKEGIEVKVKINERYVTRISNETLYSPIANFTVGKYPPHEGFDINWIKTIPGVVVDFIGEVTIRGKTEEIK